MSPNYNLLDIRTNEFENTMFWGLKEIFWFVFYSLELMTWLLLRFLWVFAFDEYIVYWDWQFQADSIRIWEKCSWFARTTLQWVTCLKEWHASKRQYRNWQSTKEKHDKSESVRRILSHFCHTKMKIKWSDLFATDLSISLQ